MTATQQPVEIDLATAAAKTAQAIQRWKVPDTIGDDTMRSLEEYLGLLAISRNARGGSVPNLAWQAAAKFAEMARVVLEFVEIQVLLTRGQLALKDLDATDRPAHKYAPGGFKIRELQRILKALQEFLKYLEANSN